MDTQDKSKEELTTELDALRLRVTELEQSKIELKRAKEALLLSEDRAQALLDAPTESAILIDPKGLVIATNSMATKYLGMNHDELIGQSIFDFLPPEISKTRNQKVFQVVQTGTPVRFEDAHKGRFYDHHVYPLIDAHGKVTQIAIYSHDVSATKLAETRVKQRTSELIASEEKYRTLVENVPLVVYRLGPGGEVLFVNQLVEEVFGYSPTELFQTPMIWREKVYHEDRARVQNLRDESFQKGKEFLAEYRVTHKKGHIVTVSDHAIPLKGADGSITSVDGIIMDVSGRIKMQEELVQAEELKTISEISARLAHEIRNPLVSAGGFARRLLSSMKEDDPNRTKVEIILKEVGRLETILRMILNYIHPLELQMSPIDLNRLVETVLNGVEREAGERNIALGLRLDSSLPKISVDPVLMETVIEALLKHALNQIKEGTPLSIISFREKEVFRLTMRYSAEHVSPDDVDHCFYPFTTPQTGYDTADLPIAKLVIDKHGGTISVCLEKSEEVVIDLSLPLL